MFEEPQSFGLPVTKDVYVADREQDGAVTMDVANRKLARPKAIVGYCMELGSQGKQHHAGALALDAGEFRAFMAKDGRTKERLLRGMEQVGLSMDQSGDWVTVTNHRFPLMANALPRLAARCAEHTEPAYREFYFARCDFGAKVTRIHCNCTGSFPTPSMTC